MWVALNITNANAAILCGGKSTRMGTDKALLSFNNDYLILNEIKQLDLIFSKIFLISNDEYKFNDVLNGYNISIIKDIYAEKGPLGGIYTALKSSNTPYVFIMACDMPQPDAYLIQQMYSFINQNQVVLAGYDGNIEPLFAFYHQSCLPIIKEHLNNNCLKIRDIFKQLLTQIYWINDIQKSSITNLNTPQEFKKWLTKE